MKRKLYLLIASAFFSVSIYAQPNTQSADEMNASVVNSSNTIVNTTQTYSVNNYNRIMSGCDSITTTYASNNGLAGIMFDVIADSNLTINGMYTNLSVDSGVFEIYYKTGTFIGYEQNSSVWTLLGSSNVISNGINIPTHLPIPFSIAMNTGDTIAFYVTNTTGGSSGLRYTNATGTGALFISNGALSIYIGKGVTYPFGSGSIFNDRAWNGTLNYCTTTTGINNIETQSISTMPNPSAGNVVFTFGNNTFKKFSLMSPDGKLIKEDMIRGLNYTLERNNLVNGIYIYQLCDEKNNVYTGKIIFK